MDKKLNILLGSASISTDKYLESILEHLHKLSECYELHIQVITNNDKLLASNDNTVKKLIEKFHNDQNEWDLWKKIGDPVLHIDLTKWADIFIVAPMGLVTLAKVAIGICDDLLTCTLRAWNPNKPVIFAPVLPINGSNSRLTSSHILTLKSWGYREISPVYEGASLNDKYSVEGPRLRAVEIYNCIHELLKNKS